MGAARTLFCGSKRSQSRSGQKRSDRPTGTQPRPGSPSAPLLSRPRGIAETSGGGTCRRRERPEREWLGPAPPGCQHQTSGACSPGDETNRRASPAHNPVRAPGRIKSERCCSQPTCARLSSPDAGAGKARAGPPPDPSVAGLALAAAATAGAFPAAPRQARPAPSSPGHRLRASGRNAAHRRESARGRRGRDSGGASSGSWRDRWRP